MKALLCVAFLVDCEPTETVDITDFERELGDYTPDRWAWRFGPRLILPAHPIRCSGAQGLWTPRDEDVALGGLL